MNNSVEQPENNSVRRADQIDEAGGSTGLKRPQSWIVAVGRSRKAGYVVGLGGLGIVVSAFLPWVSVLGIAGVGLSGIEPVLVVLLGGALTYFGWRILTERTSRRCMVVMWVLAGLDAFVSVALFESMRSNNAGGLISPAFGFYLAMFGLIASVIGTLLMQTTRTKGAVAGTVWRELPQPPTDLSDR